MPAPIPALAVSAYTLTTALGTGRRAHVEALQASRSGLSRNDFSQAELACWIGRVDAVEQRPLPAAWADWDCRNNRLAWMALAEDGFHAAALAARERYGADRVALVLGTSTASIGATEQAYRQRDANGALRAEDLAQPRVHTPHSLTGFVAAALGLRGPALTISTACSSSAKVFASAERLLRLGLVDAAVVGGVDSLCDSTLFGFNSLELISAEPCRPFGLQRRGISIGEAAGFALLERVEQATTAPRLLGYGESSDAYHMSSPHPEGLGAELALRDALARADLRAEAIDYINLHGTGSQKNDEVEASLVERYFSARTRASSTKTYTGHTLGAAGIVEAGVCLLALEHGMVPGNLGGDRADPQCGPQLAWAREDAALHIALSHSFGFGGNNACLLFARGESAA